MPDDTAQDTLTGVREAAEPDPRPSIPRLAEPDPRPSIPRLAEPDPLPAVPPPTTVERAQGVVADIAELAAGQSKLAGQAEKAATQAASDGDPVPKAPTPKTGTPQTVVQRVRRQSAVVDGLASLGVKRKELTELLVNLDAQIISWCIDGAASGLSWPEIHEALGAEAGGPSQLHGWAIPTEDRLYARAKAGTGTHPPLGWAPPRTVNRKKKAP